MARPVGHERAGAPFWYNGRVARRLPERPRPRTPRWLARAPIGLYQAGLGWLLGERFLLLHHVGARTGLPRRTILEVTRHDRDADVYYVAVGFGAKSHWYRNLRRTPEARILVGIRRIEVRARVLAPDESAEILVDYARRRPDAARKLSRFCGWEVDGSERDYREACRHGLRLVAFEPRDALLRLGARVSA